MITKPFVSILLVNFNGRQLLKTCLESVFLQDYPPEKFEVILVDNDSQDDSVTYVSTNFPTVTIVELTENQGFAGGNNAAFAHAKGEYIVLLNTDTRVETTWLTELVAAAEPETIGIVSSKLYFDVPFIELTIKTPVELKSNIYNVDDFSPLGVIVEDIHCQKEENSKLVWYQTGFYPPVESNYRSRWTNGNGKVLLPFADKKVEKYSISVHGHPHTQNASTPISFYIGETLVLEDEIHSREVKQFNLSIARDTVQNQFKNVVQNAGNIVFKDGYSRDRGSIIKRTEKQVSEFYDYDSDYYRQPAKLLSMCGASCLIKREVINQVGLFDPAYFMYYEDVDLSLKAWRMGWDIAFAPKSIAYHKHRATTNKQSSVFFHAMLIKNHLFILLTHFSLKAFIIQFFILMLKFSLDIVVIFMLKKIKYYGTYHKIFSTKADSKKLALQGLYKHAVQIYKTSKVLEQSEKRSKKEMSTLMY